MKKRIKMKKLLYVIVAALCLVACGKSNENIKPEYVDLGLPSGTKWMSVNESNPNDEYDYFTYDEAVNMFGDQLPTDDQLRELHHSCDWKWTKNGAKVTGPNGNSIFIPAEGSVACDGRITLVGEIGAIWSSTPFASGNAWELVSGDNGVYVSHTSRCSGNSVRLVK